jgi:CheY-like chemotaxis protein/DNA-directed RNA polymerase specialized sigma24 family protein
MSAGNHWRKLATYAGTGIVSAMDPKLHALLPRLRRYARAATGSVPAGDAAVAESLPGVAAALRELSDDNQAPGALHQRALHRALAALVRVLDTSRVVPLPVGGTVADAVAALPRDARHALLLTLIEGLREDEAAAVLGRTVEAIRQSLASARASLWPLQPARVLIIEDEPLVASHIASVVEELGHAVCGLAADETEAWLAARRTRPELILADLDLGAGGNGLEIARRIVANDDVPVVLVTGNPSAVSSAHALVVRKPYREAALRAAIGRALAGRHAAVP